MQNFHARWHNNHALRFPYRPRKADIPLPSPRLQEPVMNTLSERVIALFLAVALSGVTFDALIV